MSRSRWRAHRGLALLAVLASVVALPSAEAAVVHSTGVTANQTPADTGGYPYWNAVCEWGDAGGPHCAKSGDEYDWGYWNGDTFQPYDQWGYEYRNCTSYVAWRLSEAGVSASLFTDLGNADQWIGAVRGKSGVTVNSTPSAGAVAVWDSPGVGHVAWVDSVSGSTVTVSDYNYAETGAYDQHSIASTPSGYIHFPGSGGGTVTAPALSVFSANQTYAGDQINDNALS